MAELCARPYRVLPRAANVQRAGIDEIDSSLNGSSVAIRRRFATFNSVGLDRIVGDNRAFTSVPRETIVEGLCERLPKNRIVLEVLSDIVTDPQVTNTLEDLGSQGYLVAVQSHSDRAFAAGEIDSADIARINVAELSEEQLQERVEALSRLNVQVLEAHVDTYENVEIFQRYYFDLYEGYFCCSPRLANVDILANRLAALRILTKLRQPEISIEELEETITNDVSLSYKLLRYVNSAFIGLNQTVNSISHAIRIVGIDRI